MNKLLQLLVDGRSAGAPGESIPGSLQGVTVVDWLSKEVGIQSAGLLDQDVLSDIVPNLTLLIEAGPIAAVDDHGGVEGTVARAQIANGIDDTPQRL